MSAIQQLITNHLDIWTSAETEKKSGRGRSSGNGDTVYGIKKLRELILELAVRGKLVPQDPKDEPAGELLKRIQAEKARLVKEGKIKKEKVLPEIGEDEKPFELPTGWEWVRLADLVTVLNGRAYKKEELLSSGTPVLRVGNLFTSDSWYYSDLTLEEDKYCDTGDLLFAWSASFGPVIWNGGKVIYHYHIWKIDFLSQMDLYKKYLYTFLLEQTQKIKAAGHGVMMIHMTKEKMEKLVVHLPPLAEQHRIVAKVDELMTLCDQLETQHNNATDAHEKLVSHLLGTLTQSRDSADFNANWQRIAEHFDTLFTTEHSIDTLKQTLLQLAVMGKLVPQDPNDEPASELLKRIQTEKAKLIAAGKIKKEKPLPSINDEEKPFELPSAWCWVRLCELLPEFQNGVASRGDKNGKPIVVLRLADITSRRIDLSDTRALPIDSSAANKYKIEIGDILIIRVNGSSDIVGQFIPCDILIDAIYCDHFIRMRISPKLYDFEFLSLVGSSELIRERIKDLFITTAGQKTVNQGHIGSLQIPLLCVAEQRRIVKKVNELMTLCEQLKFRITDSARLKQRLADALVEQALAV